jgi:ATP-binding cassette, subfamily B, bacterial PglK
VLPQESTASILGNIKIIFNLISVSGIKKTWLVLTLSGQRQRIGIARALYRRLRILILDESTTGLDSRTENLILSKISNTENIIIIMITSKLETLKYCDRAIVLNDGTLSCIDLYDNLINTCSDFKQLF